MPIFANSLEEEIKVKVLFDSNIYRDILDISTARHSNKAAVEDVHNAIVNKKIQGILSDTIFTIEAIPRKLRYKALSSSQVEVHIFGDNDSEIPIRELGEKNKISLDKWRKKYSGLAISLGFKFVKLPRLGNFNSSIPREYYLSAALSEAEYHKINNIVGEFSRLLETRGLGIAQLKRLGEQTASSKSVWYKRLENADPEICAKLVGEWADADSVAVCKGYEIDYFCSEDKGKSAISTSIMSPENVEWLKIQHNINVITLNELHKIIQNSKT